MARPHPFRSRPRPRSTRTWRGRRTGNAWLRPEGRPASSARWREYSVVPLGGEFVWVPAAGGAVTVIAPTGTRDVPHFRTDQPDRIYAYSPDEGLVSFRWDGTDVKQHVRVRGSGGQNGRGMHEEMVALPRRVFPVHPEVLGLGRPGGRAGFRAMERWDRADLAARRPRAGSGGQRTSTPSSFPARGGSRPCR